MSTIECLMNHAGGMCHKEPTKHVRINIVKRYIMKKDRYFGIFWSSLQHAPVLKCRAPHAKCVNVFFTFFFFHLSPTSGFYHLFSPWRRRTHQLLVSSMDGCTPRMRASLPYSSMTLVSGTQIWGARLEVYSTVPQLMGRKIKGFTESFARWIAQKFYCCSWPPYFLTV